MTTATAQIAQHLNVVESAIVRVEEWVKVMFVVVKGIGARFVSKKVVKMPSSVSYKNVVFTPINKAIVEVNGKRETLTRFTLTKYGVPASELDVLFFDLCQMVGKEIKGQPKAEKKSVVKSQLNPEWVRHNNLFNEGCEGYNPHPKYL